MREQAIAEYHDMLSADESLTPQFFARLKAWMSAHRLVYGERGLCVALRPYLLTRAQYDRLAQASQVLAGAFNKVAAALVATPALMDRVGLRQRERELALVDPGFAHPTITARLDAFVYGDEVKFVEYNAENPSSLPDQEGLNQLLFEVRALQALARHYRLRQFDPVAAMLEALLSTYQEWGGKGAPNVAIVDWADLPTANEFFLLRNYFASRGVPTIICTPDELEYTGGRLRRGDFRIDLVYKRVVIHEFLARYEEAHPLTQAYINHHVCLVNPFRCKILHKKAGFELLTDEAHESWFTSTEREVIRRTVPWTRMVTEKRTLYRGQAIDLLPYLRKHRSNFILKPNDDYGGHGIFLGHRLSEAEWDDKLAAALDQDFVVQEIVTLRTEEFPVFDEQQWSLQPMYVDTNPFIFRGRVEGAMVRLSDSPIVNVTSGGGETGFFVIEGRS
jgi:glutathionylspermidine synthase